MDISFEEAHFSELPSQGNIYGLSSLTVGTTNKVLVASLRRKVFCVDYAQSRIPSTREINFTYIPAGAEIISVDAFNKSLENHDFVIGITFIKSSESQSSQYLNIYSDWEPGRLFDLDIIAQGCQSLELDFIPYQLTHAQLHTSEGTEIVCLLSGSDCKVHLYREDHSQQCFFEQTTTDFFPEFDDLPSIVHAINTCYIEENKKRLTAVGCEDGYIRMCIVNVNSNDMLKKLRGDKETTFQLPEIHLLVISTLEPSVVYWNAYENDLTQQLILPESDYYDCVTCGIVADINMDGKNEILLGTYGQELLVYKLEKKDNGPGCYKLIFHRSFSHPLLSLAYLDIIGDGVKELLAFSTKGLHILQHDLKKVSQLCQQRLQKLAALHQCS
ncbi:KICSTOR complex protein kaptin-like isoform X2 [Limulus polyphemus]|uniref:KICSTOR complex protein kaptin-like isoform X2 n=1 Tax=Limulus polyphemus TaxID=6850 RepID=A0ABM1T6M5_LIMPO|nr:KICSTOR complex protein kaptin-like isoform X2 [Limulus polyphemus]